MKPIEANGYSIFFNAESYEVLNQHVAQKAYSGIFIITDTNSNEQCLPQLLSNLTTEINIEIIEIEPGEESKNIDTCVEVWKILTDFGADRKSLIINLGGGVVTDLGGFVASTFKRGIAFIHIPTTLLAMVDASVGGKNGVDLGALKNQIGVISNPEMVLIDTAFLDSLPQNQMRSGLAEMLKHGLIFDKTYWNRFTDLSKIDFADFDALIHRSVTIKNTIVMQDPTENGIRKALNYGHTIGHAIESYFLQNPTKETLLHGEAIAAGMVLEAFMSLSGNKINSKEYYEIKNVINGIYKRIIFDDADLGPILELLIHDKKNEYGNIQFALLDGIGGISINQNVENEIIMQAFHDYKS